MRGAVVALALAAACRGSEAPVEDFAGVGVAEARLTPAAEAADTLVSVERAGHPDLYYRVTLTGAPVGSELPLGCDWIDPTGTVVHRNRYRTRRIDRERWPTWCHHVLDASAATGRWRVQMTLEGRVLTESSFDLR